MFSLVVFDLDGTLIDSRRDITDSANELLVACGGHPLPEEAIGRMVGEGTAVLVARAFAAAGMVQPDQALDQYLAIYSSRLLSHTRPYPGVREALDTVKSRARLAVLTNKPLAPTRRILDGLQLSAFFEAGAVIGGDGPWPRKPDPSSLRHLVSRVGGSLASSVLVGDSLIDWRTARAAGTRICMARYGFGFHSFPSAELAPTDLVADAADELPRVLGV